MNGSGERTCELHRMSSCGFTQEKISKALY